MAGQNPQVSQCNGNWISVDITLQCQWSFDNAAAYLALAFLNPVTYSAPITFASKEMGAAYAPQLYITEPQARPLSLRNRRRKRMHWRC